jgi:hypothetical protein
MFERNQRWPIGPIGKEGQRVPLGKEKEGQKGHSGPSEPPATQWPLGWRIPSGKEVDDPTPPRAPGPPSLPSRPLGSREPEK